MELFIYASKSPELQKQYKRNFKMFLDFIELGGIDIEKQPMSTFSRRNILEAFEGRRRYQGQVKWTLIWVWWLIIWESSTVKDSITWHPPFTVIPYSDFLVVWEIGLESFWSQLLTSLQISVTGSSILDVGVLKSGFPDVFSVYFYYILCSANNFCSCFMLIIIIVQW